MNIKQYIQNQVQRINTVLQREKLACSLVATVQGPLSLTYKLRVNNPDRQAMTHLVQLGSVLQSVLLVESVRIQQVSGLIEIQIPSPMPITPTATDMRNASQGLAVAIGWDAMGKPLTIDFRQHGAVFWVGPSRRGKTQSMRSTLYSVSKSVQSVLRYCIICQASKLGDWQAFDTSKHSMGIVTDFDEIEQAIRWFSRRTQQGRTNHEYIVLVDDLPSILQRCKIAKDLADIASVGAGVSVHLLAGTQAAGSKAGSGGELIEANITARIVYKPASKATAARNAGQGGMDLDQLSSAKGDAVLLVDGYPERIATSIAYDTEIATLPQGRINATWRPWTKAEVVQPVPVSGTHTGYVPALVPVKGGTLVYGVGAPVVPVQVVQDSTPAIFKLPMDRTLTLQEKLQLCEVYAQLGSKNKTCVSVFGYKSPKTLALLDDALQVGANGTDKIIKLSERRTA